MAILAAAAVPAIGPSTFGAADTGDADAYRRATWTGAQMRFAVDTAEVWVHGRLRASGPTSGNIFYVRYATGNIRMSRASATELEINHFDGTTAVTETAFTAFGDGDEFTVDMHVASDGTVETYIDGVLISTDSTFTPSGNVTRVDISQNGGSAIAFSEILIADASTVGYRVADAYPTADGTETTGSGAYTAVDEIIYSLDNIAGVSGRRAVAVEPPPAGTIAAVVVAGVVVAGIFDTPPTSFNFYLRQAAGIVDGATINAPTSVSGGAPDVDSLTVFETSEAPSEIGVQRVTGAPDIHSLSAAIVLSPTPSGTARTDLLARVAGLGVASVVQTGVTVQGDVPVDRTDSEFVVGELTPVEVLTVTWTSGPTTEQLVAFNRVLGSPRFQVTHA